VAINADGKIFHVPKFSRGLLLASMGGVDRAGLCPPALAALATRDRGAFGANKLDVLRIVVVCQAVVWQLSFLKFFYKESRMMRLCSMVLVAVFAVSLAGSAWAAEGAKKKEGGAKKGEAKKVSMEDRFAKMDKNSDKKLDMDEFKGRATKEETIKEREKQFAEMDKNKDKAVTLDEMKEHFKAKVKEKKPKGEKKEAKAPAAKE
jgi:hypothetical protein